MTQVLTGHGCFGEYLWRIGKERTVECHHCDCPHDSAQHTLEACPAWAAERADLVVAVGTDLSLPAIVRAMVGSGEAWKAVSSFCGKVMLRKENAERERERRGEGRRRRATPSPPGDGGRMPLPIGPPPRRRRHRSSHRPSLVRIEGEDDLDRGRGPGKPASPPPAEEGRGVLPREAIAPRSSIRDWRRSPPGAWPNLDLAGERGSPPLEGHQRKSPGVQPESRPFPGKGGGPTPGLGGPGLERETRAPTPPPGNPEGARRDAPLRRN